ncbi:heme NO-binding domain-containing protein [Marivita geojedonensis]|uniref:Heme NO-binding domain-containing protein n=1 Tax=Marivita geojedonensis TaxID=1123756 RepID=A0A1X4NFD2_9RHOB|nr:heme NO-binding domain-containing protein [Marivita geojedonensis]OSQ45647.1 hypothetical protein MGEO_18215 [Marivita geojedonensis]PRY73988.1 heme-NO-binding protein [Marivita geojedonensis]
MHGLIFRTIQAFVTDSFGSDYWSRVIVRSGVDVPSFEAMLQYEPAHLCALLSACAEELDRSQDVILEDIGAYLITHQKHASIRRLMRFGGDSFPELLHSLDELPGRTRLAVSGLDLPQIRVREPILHQYTIDCVGPPAGFGHVLVGLLRALADDYGTLAVLTHVGRRDEAEVIEVSIVDTGFAEDRGFSLSDAAEATVQ